jgi:phosphonate transport system permease protein
LPVFAGFWPPAHDADFLGLLYEATLQTLAVATAGMALALLLACRLACWPAVPVAACCVTGGGPGGRDPVPAGAGAADFPA